VRDYLFGCLENMYLLRARHEITVTFCLSFAERSFGQQSKRVATQAGNLAFF